MGHKLIKTFVVKYEPKRSIFLGKQENSWYNLTRRVFHFHDNPFLDQFLYFLVNNRIFVIVKNVARQPVLNRVGRQFSTGSPNIRQNYTIISKIFPCCKMSSDSPRLKVVATLRRGNFVATLRTTCCIFRGWPLWLWCLHNFQVAYICRASFSTCLKRVSSPNALWLCLPVAAWFCRQWRHHPQSH